LFVLKGDQLRDHPHRRVCHDATRPLGLGLANNVGTKACRELADKLVRCPEREALLEKARQAETASSMYRRLPGLRPNLRLIKSRA